MLRWMGVITERLDGDGKGGWQMEKQKRGKEKKIEQQKATMEDVGTRVMKERKMDSEKVCRCASARQQTPLCYLSPLGCDYRSGSVQAPADTTLQLRNKQPQRASLQLPLYPEDDTIFKSSTLSADIYIIALENYDFTPSLTSIKAAQMDQSRKMKPSSDTDKNNSNICLRGLLQI